MSAENGIVIKVEDLTKVYDLGKTQVPALCGVTFDRREETSSWPSWGRPARGNRP